VTAFRMPPIRAFRHPVSIPAGACIEFPLGRSLHLEAP
jgi:hypothetical protein